MSLEKTSLNGKRALVCGGSKGLGKATAIALAERGAQVILLSRNQAGLEAARKELPGSGHEIIVADLSKVELLETALQNSKNLFSTPVNILVNNAGGPPGGPIVSAKIDEFKSALETHLYCSHMLVHHCLPGMKQSGYGRILNIISTSVKQPIPGLGVSNTTRGAMASWSKTLAFELAPFGITVNNILPGATTTDRLAELFEARAKSRGVPLSVIEEEWKAEIPMGRFGRPDEFGAVAAFLASPAASYVTGVSIPVDGGRVSAL